MSTEDFDSKRTLTDVNVPVPPGMQTTRLEEYRPAFSDPLIGQTHRNFRLVKALGHGGMGKVYLAERTDGVINQRVAIKMMHGEVAESAHLMRRFRTERSLCASACAAH